MTGQNLIHYRIIDQIGYGGMGAVYKAYDTRLLRHVAIKLLRPELMVDQNKRRRFIKEAQTASSLNHPNICTIHDINEDSDQHFIVMELVEGETLREILERRGKIPEAELTDIAIKICEALSVVHKKGISHRDIKPENIMITNNGLVKVMDFGLAKLATEYAESVVEMEASENWRNDYVDNVVVTNLSGLLGTVHYMSPEQAQGNEIDQRSDIFSLGIMLCELLTGHKPFDGDSNLDILTKIIKAPSEMDFHSINVSPEFKSILSRALEKDVKNRYQSVAELLDDLKDLKSAGSVLSAIAEESISPDRSGKNSTRSILLFSILMLVIVTTLVIFFQSNQKQTDDLPPMRTVRFTSYPGVEYDPAFSPDGKSVAFSWNGQQQDNLDIYVKRIDGGDPIRLTTNRQAERKPVWSPDGSMIAFVRNNPENQHDLPKEIDIMSSSGGKEREIINFSPGVSWPKISWSMNNKSIYYQNWSDEDKGFNIYKVSIETHEIEQITFLPSNIWGDQAPVLSPDGKYLAFLRGRADNHDIYTKNLTGNRVSRVTHINRIIDGFCWGKDSKSFIFAANLDGTSGVWKAGMSNGKPEKILSGRSIQYPDFYAPGNQFIYQEQILTAHIWKIDLQNPDKEKLFIGSSLSDLDPDISTDGEKITFFSDRSGTYNVWVCNADGSNQRQMTHFNNHTWAGYSKWSPDGNKLLVSFQDESYLLKTSKSTIQKIGNLGSWPVWTKDGNNFYAAPAKDNKLCIVSKDGKIQKQLNIGSAVAPKTYGNYIYYVKDFDKWDIWRAPLDGNNEEPVLQGVPGLAFRSWDIVKDGIYFFRSTDNSNLLCFYDFKTKHISEIRDIPAAHVGFLTIDIDPEEQYLLYSKFEPNKSDIIMVENFLP